MTDHATKCADPTYRAIQAVLANWHYAGCLLLLRGSLTNQEN